MFRSSEELSDQQVEINGGTERQHVRKIKNAVHPSESEKTSVSLSLAPHRFRYNSPVGTSAAARSTRLGLSSGPVLDGFRLSPYVPGMDSVSRTEKTRLLRISSAPQKAY